MSRSPADSSGGYLSRVRKGDPLTRREREILALVAAGERTTAISRRLGISQNTIKSHLTAVYRKTGSRNRVEAARHHLERAPAADPSREPLLQRQIDEIEARLEELAPVVTEAERLQEALAALRGIQAR